MVPGAGIEPARGFPRGILSPSRTKSSNTLQQPAKARFLYYITF